MDVKVLAIALIFSAVACSKNDKKQNQDQPPAVTAQEVEKADKEAKAELEIVKAEAAIAKPPVTNSPFGLEAVGTYRLVDSYVKGEDPRYCPTTVTLAAHSNEVVISGDRGIFISIKKQERSHDNADGNICSSGVEYGTIKKNSAKHVSTCTYFPLAHIRATEEIHYNPKKRTLTVSDIERVIGLGSDNKTECQYVKN